MNKHFASKFLKVFLSILLFIMGIAMAGILCMIGIEITGGEDNVPLLDAFFTLINILAYFFVIFDLRKFMLSIGKDIYCCDNVIRFKRISICMFIIAAVDAVMRFKERSNVEILNFGYGSFKGSFILFLVLGCFALVLAETFQDVISQKKGNI